jgi:hypothetical protein
MADPQPEFLTRWHRIVSEKDVAALGSVLAEDITMGAPPYWERLAGVELVQHLLGIIVSTIEDFTYHREWQDEGELALEFTGHVGNLELQGIDLISLDDELRIRSLDVLMRPISTVIALRDIVAPQMAAYLADRAKSSS